MLSKIFKRATLTGVVLGTLFSSAVLADGELAQFFRTFPIVGREEEAQQNFLAFVQDAQAVDQLVGALGRLNPLSTVYQAVVPINMLVQYARENNQILPLADIVFDALSLGGANGELRPSMLELLSKLDSPRACQAVF